MDSRICLPSLKVVLMVNVPLGWLLRRSAKFRPYHEESYVITLNLHPMNSPIYCELQSRLTHKLHLKTVPNAKDWFAAVLNTTASSYIHHICPNSPEAALLHSWICRCARSQWTYRHGFYLKAETNQTLSYKHASKRTGFHTSGHQRGGIKTVFRPRYNQNKVKFRARSSPNQIKVSVHFLVSCTKQPTLRNNIHLFLLPSPASLRAVEHREHHSYQK